MEAAPEWIDFDLVREGARQERIPAALLAPFITRGAFIATFTNSYAALPMALTGALSGRRAARRVNETASFFAVTALPGALDRYGPGFEAAAMVRLMHSMVRYNALKKSDKRDVDVYGMPVPQVDQMPAGMIGQYLMSQKVLRQGRTVHRRRTRRRRIRQISLLFARPAGGVTARLTHRDHPRHACPLGTSAGRIRAGLPRTRPRHDDGLSASTTSLFDRGAEAVEKGYSKLTFVRAFCSGDREIAAAMGVSLELADLVRIALTTPFIIGRFIAVRRASRIPVLRGIIDAYIIGLLKLRLATYGKPEFTSDAAHYTPGRTDRV